MIGMLHLSPPGDRLVGFAFSGRAGRGRLRWILVASVSRRRGHSLPNPVDVTAKRMPRSNRDDLFPQELRFPVPAPSVARAFRSKVVTAGGAARGFLRG